ncbi:MAG: AmmeMemoRadiSam system protein B [Patescibacteria group bacterium]|nr:AmmeMemoRadiSam system protein B [Patescibacteria group bacterium]
MKNVIIISGLVLLILSIILLARFQLAPKTGVELDNQMKTKEPSVRRPPAVAGAFYPAGKKELQKQIKDLLSANGQMPNDQMIKLLIVPHAGYDYSGPVAAAGFNSIGDQKISRVILIGSSHQSWFEGAAIDQNDFWQTPLGKVEVDLEFGAKLTDQTAKIVFSSQLHSQEHSLEVELPFLQSVLNDFKIVPILIGSANKNTLEKLAGLISENFDSQTLVLISTDLSHYPNDETAKKVDQKTIEGILSGDTEKFEKNIQEQMSVGYPNLETCVCAEKAVIVGMLIARKLAKETPGVSPGSPGVKEASWQLIKYANSGDSDIGDPGRVVGYAAIIWAQPNYDPGSSSIKTERSGIVNGQDKYTSKQKELLLKIARETLESYLKDKTKPKYEIDDPKLNEKLGAFVTLTKNGQLRGCIGEFSPSEDPLWQVVQSRVIDAAVNDHRFSAVGFEELKEIEIEISVLSKPEKISDWRKIEMGKHGVVLRQGLNGGTFLPQVAAETGWDREEFLSQLCSQKAGLLSDCYKNPKTEIMVYTAEVFSESESG